MFPIEINSWSLLGWRLWFYVRASITSNKPESDNINELLEYETSNEQPTIPNDK